MKKSILYLSALVGAFLIFYFFGLKPKENKVNERVIPSHSESQENLPKFEKTPEGENNKESKAPNNLSKIKERTKKSTAQKESHNQKAVEVADKPSGKSEDIVADDEEEEDKIYTYMRN